MTGKRSPLCECSGHFPMLCPRYHERGNSLCTICTRHCTQEVDNEIAIRLGDSLPTTSSASVASADADSEPRKRWTSNRFGAVVQPIRNVRKWSINVR